MRYFLYFSYDGAAYHGWQLQPNADSVQAHLDAALSTLLRAPIATVGAGRTDAGVNAACMVAHFDYPAPSAAEDAASPSPLDAKTLCHKLNRMLPPDIAVSRLRPVRPEAHARFSATGRTYRYHVYSHKSPFLRHYAARLHFTPDYDAMNRAAAALLTARDFTSFSKLHSDARTNLCHVTHATWAECADGTHCFEITADRFLRNMVRAVVGTLLDVGRGRLSEADFRAIIAQRDRCAAGESVPGHALSLVDVAYPEALFLNEA